MTNQNITGLLHTLKFFQQRHFAIAQYLQNAYGSLEIACKHFDALQKRLSEEALKNGIELEPVDKEGSSLWNRVKTPYEG